MNKTPIILNNRSIITISGVDQKTFLQGLLTNDVNKITESSAIYAFYLSPQGRFLYDFFIILDGEKLLMDVASDKADEIVQKLSFYKLRSKVQIQKEPDLSVLVAFDKNVFVNQKIVFSDPRSEKMGYRSFAANHEKVNDDASEYNFQRINLKIPDDSDLTFDKSFPVEFGFDNLGAIDYKKGCYVGQETTARMHYKGVIRKKIFLIEVLQNQINKGDKIISEEKEIGEILSSVFYQDKLFALALIKNLDNDGKEINLNELGLVPKVKIITHNS